MIGNLFYFRLGIVIVVLLGICLASIITSHKDVELLKKKIAEIEGKLHTIFKDSFSEDDLNRKLKYVENRIRLSSNKQNQISTLIQSVQKTIEGFRLSMAKDKKFFEDNASKLKSFEERTKTVESRRESLEKKREEVDRISESARKCIEKKADIISCTRINEDIVEFGRQKKELETVFRELNESIKINDKNMLNLKSELFIIQVATNKTTYNARNLEERLENVSRSSETLKVKLSHYKDKIEQYKELDERIEIVSKEERRLNDTMKSLNSSLQYIMFKISGINRTLNNESFKLSHLTGNMKVQQAEVESLTAQIQTIGDSARSVEESFKKYAIDIKEYKKAFPPIDEINKIIDNSESSLADMQFCK